jgi:hypothetical protein
MKMREVQKTTFLCKKKAIRVNFLRNAAGNNLPRQSGGSNLHDCCNPRLGYLRAHNLLQCAWIIDRARDGGVDAFATSKLNADVTLALLITTLLTLQGSTKMGHTVSYEL